MNLRIYIFLLLILASCKNAATDKDAISYAQKKKTVIQHEQKNPLLFLKVEGLKKKNIIGQTVLKGTITNTAAICAYKNVRVKMLAYGGSEMKQEHEDVVNDIVLPNSTIHFKTRYRLPKSVDSVALSIMSAEVVTD